MKVSVYRIQFLILCCCFPYAAALQSIVEKRIDSLLRLLQTMQEDTVKIRALNELAQEFLLRGDHKKTAIYLDSALLLADRLQARVEKGRTYNILGSLERDRGNYPGALRFYQTAYTIMEEAKNKKGAARSLINAGIVYDAQGDYLTALKSYQAALRLFEAIGDKEGIASYYGNVSNVHFDQGNYLPALEQRLKALGLHMELGNIENIGTSYHDVGRIYIQLGNYKMAQANLEEALKIREQFGHKRTIAGTYHQLGIVHMKQGNYPEALKNHMRSLTIKDELNDKRGLANSYEAIGNVYLKQQKYTDARNTFSAALKIREEIGDRGGMAAAYISTGKVLLRLAAGKSKPGAGGEFRQALPFLEKGLSMARDMQIMESLLLAYECLAEVYAGLNDFKRALQYSQAYIRLSDSLRNTEISRKLEQLKTQHEVDRAVAREKERQQALLAAQRLQSEKTLADRKRKTDWLLAALAILLVISFFTVLLTRQRVQRKRAVEKAEAGHRMAELELQGLRAQLNPHFMFNSLNAIQDLILKEDNDRSHLYLSRFAKLLRLLLDNANQSFVPVKSELEFLELYLSLENLRIPDLRISIEKDPRVNLQETMIPNMMLQPFVENAIWHGLSNKKGDRHLIIRVMETGESTVFEIEDNGVGRLKAEELKKQLRREHHSRGMELLSKRFSLVSLEYGSAIHTEITDLGMVSDPAGTRVRIEVAHTLSAKEKAKSRSGL